MGLLVFILTTVVAFIAAIVVSAAWVLGTIWDILFGRRR